MTAATSSMEKALENLRTTIADCDAFRSWVSVDGDADESTQQSQALSRIHKYAVTAADDQAEAYSLENLNRLRPFALVQLDIGGGGYGLQRESWNGFGRDYAEAGRFLAGFQWEVPQEIKHQPAEIMTRFNNFLGTLLDEMATLSGQAGYLDMSSMAVTLGPYRSAEELAETEGDYIEAVLTIEWDTGGGSGGGAI